ncbi:MAG: DDE domain-containing protein [Proteobacteria bacterium]|nr:MAG: DDE domain-containing protein [Pseudomonadota bacterium]
MRRKSIYRRYDSDIKNAVAASRNPNLFPDLRLPRTTALYWIRTARKTPERSWADPEVLYEKTQSDGYGALAEAKRASALLTLFKSVVGEFDLEIKWSQVSSREKRRNILTAIQQARLSVTRNDCLSTLDLSLSRYKRWQREAKGCGLELPASCPRRSLRQLTQAEVRTMRRLVTSKEHAHFPIRSLHLLAKRENKLSCSYSTWLKYIDLYKWERHRLKPKKQFKRIGIRAGRANELWHVDVSYFILPNKEKCFIQAVVDNHSRYVVAWQVLTSFDGSKTASLLKKAIRSVNDRTASLKVMADAGGENINKEVALLEEQRLFRKVIARLDTTYSNSLIEAVFRSLKHNYLYHQQIKTFKSLRKHVDFWFREHNEKIPHSSFRGETPAERYRNTFTPAEHLRLTAQNDIAQKLRTAANRATYCPACVQTES